MWSARLEGWSIGARRALVALLPLLGPGGCGSPPPPPPPPTVAQVTLRAGPDINPTGAGQAAPVVVRVYQLASAAGFEKAEFRTLFAADAAALGADLVKKEEFLLTPGATKVEALTLPDAVTAVGVFAAFREFGTRTWRVTVPVPPHKTTPVSVAVDAAGLRVAPGTPAGP